MSYTTHEMPLLENKARTGIEELLSYLGEDPEREGLRDTPKRVLKAFKEMTVGYRQEPKEILSTVFDEYHDEIVLLKGIRFVSLCEHHLLSFAGTASVAYIPRKGVVGLSKLARLVECFAKRLQVQERMTNQIAAAVQEHLDPVGVGVVISAHHSCMGCRGVRQPDATMVTSAMRGAFREDVSARQELLSLIG